MTKEEIENEIAYILQTYREYRNRHGGVGFAAFLVGSSLCGNKQGDSARYWELRTMLDKFTHQRNDNERNKRM